VRSLARAQMPPHETCYAVTVHKAQGSEYDDVLLVLPADDPEFSRPGAGRVVTRELLYTAVTRARRGVQISAGQDVLETALGARTLRMSGLGAR
jgi:exodeoxyribonuclease V alpha subunit